MALDFATICALLSLIALVFLPGGALVVLMRPRVDDVLVRVGMAAGLGLAAQPLAALWARRAGVPMREPTIIAALAVCAMIVLWRWWAGRAQPSQVASTPQVGPPTYVASTPPVGSPAHVESIPQVAPPPHVAPPSDLSTAASATTDRALERSAAFAMLAIIVVLLAARWAVARDLTVPLWGDSVHHAMIARIFTLQAGLPRDWLPFEPLAPFTYHFGLHALTAAVAQLSGVPEHRALIVVGQSLMVLQALTAYALVAGLTGRRWAGVGAAIVAGGLGPMPGHYLNWGRYSQLAGQAILPVAALFAARAGRGDDGRRGIALAAVSVAGLALTHYLVTVFFAVFGAVWFVLGEGPAAASWLRSRVERFGRLLLAGAASVILALPWIPQFVAGRLDDHAATLMTSELPDPGVMGVVDPAWVWSQLGDFVGFGLAGAAVAAALWAIRTRDRAALLGLAWSAALVAAAYPGLFGIPVTGVLKDFAVLIGLYVPLGLLIGPALADGVDRIDRRAAGTAVPPVGAIPPAAALPAAAAVAFVIALHLAGPTRTQLDPSAVYASAADERAFEWIKANTPPDAGFLVSAVPAYGGTVMAGDDGGWWIPQLADRKTTLPPITYGLEASMEPGYRESVNALNATWSNDLDAPETVQALRSAGVGWAYVGSRGEAMGGALAASPIDDSPSWEAVYREDGATVYRAAWAEEGSR